MKGTSTLQILCFVDRAPRYNRVEKTHLDAKLILNIFSQIYMFRACLGPSSGDRLRLKPDGTRGESRFRLSAKRTSPFKSAGALVQSTNGSRGVCISGSNAGYTMFRGSVKSTSYPFHSSVFPSLPPRASPCAITIQLDSTTVCI